MKFACDGCGAQYMIADEKVGPSGVKVRCKKCSHVIVVKADDPGADSTIVMDNPLAAIGAGGSDLPFADSSDTEAELGAAFDNIFGSEGGADAFGGGSEAFGGGGGGGAMAATAAAPRPAADDPFSSAIDQAFDKALDEEPGYDDHESTRVFAAEDMARVEREKREAQAFWPGADDEAPQREDPPEPEADEGASQEWYVAIDDEQVGPLSVEDVQERWEAGDLSPDTLVWRQGMDDWIPLSTVDQLKHLIAPTPASPRAAAATAADPEPAPTPSAPAAAPAAEPAPTWKPAAASLLAALAAEEMDAIENQKAEPRLAAPSADPVGVGANIEPPAPEAPAPARSALDLDLPPPPAELPDDLEPPPASLAAAPRSMTPAPSPAAPVTVSTPEYQRPRAAFAAAAAAPAGLTTGKLVGIIAGSGGGVVAVLVAILWVAGVFDKGTAEDPAPSGETVAEAAQPAAPQTDPQPGSAPAAAAAPTEAAEATKPAEPAPAPEAAKPEVAAKAAEPPAKVAPKPEVAKAAPKPRRQRPQARRTTRRDPPPQRTPPPPKPKPEVDPFEDDTSLEESLFGPSGGGGRSKPAASASPEKPAGRGGYIPPAPGSGKDLPKALGQGDIYGVVARHKGKLKGCADQQKASDPGAGGKLVMSWRIQPNGSTTAVKCTTSQYRNTVMAKCLTQVIKGMKFPRYGGPQMDAIEFPFTF